MKVLFLYGSHFIDILFVCFVIQVFPVHTEQAFLLKEINIGLNILLVGGFFFFPTLSKKVVHAKKGNIFGLLDFVPFVVSSWKALSSAESSTFTTRPHCETANRESSFLTINFLHLFKNK